MVKISEKRARGEAWHAPAWLLELALEALGRPFDLDACAPADAQPAPAAATRHKGDSGLGREWSGAVFLNPQHGNAPLDRWLDKAVRAVHWDKSAAAVVAMLPADPESPWWRTYVRGWATVFLVRRRFRLGDDRTRPPYAAALAIWGDAAAFRAHIDAQPRSRVNGAWLSAYRAEARQAPFLQSLTTKERMRKLYGSYDEFHRNLEAWTARMPADYAAAIAGTRGQPAEPGAETEAIPGDTGDNPFRTNRWGYVTHVNGRPIHWQATWTRRRRRKSGPGSPTMSAMHSPGP